MSSYKASHEADIHKRCLRADIAQNPVIIGHEFAGEIVEVGAKWKEKFTPGAKFSIQLRTQLRKRAGRRIERPWAIRTVISAAMPPTW
ncbi:MAG: alcohol dehydrogenase catalytic domain-containing protein [Alistipes indistinctus]